MYFCTLSDKKYFIQGMVLYNSLQKTEKDFTLYWLCMDTETYASLKTLNLDNIVAIPISWLEGNDEKLRQAKNNPPSLYGNQYSQYCWALTPYFINYVLKRYIPDNEPLMYIDSDIVFYQSPQLILNDMGQHSIGIHGHRGEAKYDTLTNPVGEFNVGVVVIRNNKIGIEASEWWKDCLLNPNNRYYKIYGTCGDQKYLDLFIPLFKDVCVFDRMNCGYLAPWCYDNVSYPEEGKIIFKGITQPVVFYHFSHFICNIGADTWSDSIKGEWNPCRIPEVKKYYEDYFENIKQLNTSLKCSTL